MFGCGGDRDRSKRPLMGQAAGAGSDVVVVTSDNPRGEDPLAIIEEVLPGLSGTLRLRSLSSRIVIAPLNWPSLRHEQGDLVLLAGKGHEKTQTIGDRVIPFDDVAIARQVLRAQEEAE